MGLPAHNRARSEASFWVKTVTGAGRPVADSAKRLVAEITQIMSSAAPFEPGSRAQRVGVMSGYGLSAIHLSCDALWLMALRQRGHHGLGIICNRGLPSCEFNFRGDGSKTPRRISEAFSPWANSFTCRDCSHN